MNKNKDTLHINGYTIRYNPLWKEWQVSHPEIGVCGEFKDKSEAIKFANNG